MSLSGYEEQPAGETEPEGGTYTEESITATQTTEDEESQSYTTPSSSRHLNVTEEEGDPDFSSLTLSPSHSTPRPVKENDDITSSSIDCPPSYNAFKEGITLPDSSSESPSGAPVTPGRQRGYSGNLTATPDGSPPLPVPLSSHAKPSSTAKTARNSTDPLLHRMLDKNYRVQATPLGTSRKTNPYKTTTTSRSSNTAHHPALVTPKSKSKTGHLDSSPLSSPELEAPKLHSEIFTSPIKGVTDKFRNNIDDDDDDDDDEFHYNKTKQGVRTADTRGPPRTPKPGVSVLTPSKPKFAAPSHKPGIWDSDDDDLDDDETALYGHSPPKTMQFHVPQSRLLKTPGTVSFFSFS